ncbi:MAG: tetratricopeptide repeat protein [Planctomycetota bacterium]
MRFTFWIVLFLSLALLQADWIVLKNGNEFRGRILKKTKTTIELEVAFGKITLKIEDIQNILQEDELTALLREGKEYLHYQSYPKAIERFAQALKKDSKSEEARTFFRKTAQDYGRMLLANGSYVLAEQFFKEVQENFPQEDFAISFLQSIKEAQAEVESILKKARTLSSSNQWESALHFYEEMLKKAPSVIELYAEEIAFAHTQYAVQLPETDFENRLYHLEQALKLHPKISYQIEQIYLQDQFRCIAQDLKANQPQLAKTRLLAAQNFAPAAPEIHLYLGWVHELLGESANARRQYGMVLGISISEQVALEDLRNQAVAYLQGEKETPEYQNREYWEQVDSAQFLAVETPHFIIYARNNRVAKEVAESAEYYLEKTLARLDPSGTIPPFTIKCGIYIYPNQEEYKKFVGKSHEWTGGITQHKTTGIELKEHRILAFQSASSLIRFILPHEITHVLFRYILGYNYKPPLCMVEGIAMREEQTFQRENLKETYRRAKKDSNFIPAEQILRMRNYPGTDQVNIFYAESFIITDYLVEKFGVELFFKYCRVTSKEDPVEMLNKLYSLTPQQLDEQMTAFSENK